MYVEMKNIKMFNRILIKKTFAPFSTEKPFARGSTSRQLCQTEASIAFGYVQSMAHRGLINIDGYI
jgi:hypothetical protein